MTIADRIRIKREELSLTQDELSKRCGYSTKSSITKIEKSGNDITLKKIKRVADALGVTTSYLMGWEDEKEVSLEEQIMYADVNQDPSHLEAITYTAEQVEKAFELFKKYENADNDIKTVVDTLLKRPQQES